MREPFFSVGETVTRKGQAYPEMDGEYVVTEIITVDKFKKLCPSCFNAPGIYYYKLAGFKVAVRNSLGETGDISNHSAEQNLRKKYPPSSEGFQDMMSWLKDNVLENVD